MTTIAWDGKTLAADTRGLNGNLPRKVRKLYDCGAYVFGGVGILSDVIECAAWLRKGAPDDARQTFDDADIQGLAVKVDTGEAFYIAGKRPVFQLIEEKFASCGSGRDFALAAMALGKTSREAVELAMRFDVATGGEVEEILVWPAGRA